MGWCMDSEGAREKDDVRHFFFFFWGGGQKVLTRCEKKGARGS